MCKKSTASGRATSGYQLFEIKLFQNKVLHRIFLRLDLTRTLVHRWTCTLWTRESLEELLYGCSGSQSADLSHGSKQQFRERSPGQIFFKRRLPCQAVAPPWSLCRLKV